MTHYRYIRFCAGLLVLFVTVTARLCAQPAFVDFPSKDFPVSEAGLPVYQCSFDVGTVVLGTNWRVWIEYPEWTALSSAEERIIREGGWAVDSVCATGRLGFSRKRGVLDVTVCPIVRREGRLWRLLSGKICYAPLPTKHIAPTEAVTVADRWNSASVLREGKWVKVSVTQEGIYQFSPSSLAAMGFSDPARVKLYGYGGRPISENWNFDDPERAPDDLVEIPLYRKANGTVLFFAEGTLRTNCETGWHDVNPYSDQSCYFLTEGDEPLAFRKISASQSAPAQTLEAVPYVAVLDNDAFAWYSGGREMYDSYDFAYGNTHTFNLATPHPATGEALVYVAFGAASQLSATKVEVEMNGNQLGSLSINKFSDAQSGYEARNKYTVTTLTDRNAFRFTTTAGNAARLNFIRVKYDRTLRADDAAFSFSPAVDGVTGLRVAGAKSSTRLWAIGNASETAAEVESSLQGDVLTATVADGRRRYVCVDIDADYPTPATVGKVANQNLHADGAADMVIIVPESGKLQEEAERLAAYHREHDGLRVNVVNAGCLYNEFSSGTPDASAYRRYMKMLYDRAETEADLPAYLLMFGNSLWDNRLRTDGMKSLNTKDYLLSFQVSEGALNKVTGAFALGELTSYVTDDFYGWLDDGEGTTYALNKLDVGIGRFLCSDPTEAKVLVDKVIAYAGNAMSGAWKNKIYVLADYGNANLHMNDATPVAEQLVNSTSNRAIVKKVFWDAYERTTTAIGYRFPEVTTMLQGYMQEGALMFDYSGHGSPDQLSHAQLLVTADFNASSGGRLPLWVMASCEICPFDALQDDIGRTAVLNPNGGAISMICAARSVYSNYNKELNISLSKHLFETDDTGRLITMGEALRRTKVDMVTAAPGTAMKDASMNKLKYVLLGDPALALAAPTGLVRLDSINGKAIKEGDPLVQLKAGSLARFSGSVVGLNGDVDATFNGLVTATVADREETITCNNYDGASKAITYQDRPNVIFEGSNRVSEGRFSITMRVPRSLSYSNDAGRITLFATNEDHTLDCNGYSESFCLNGTETAAEPDTLAPVIHMYLDEPANTSGCIVGPQPTLYAEISDDFGIAAAGSSPGAIMELIIDGDYNNPVSLNNYFSFDFGSYNAGLLTYPLETLTAGAHQLQLQAWDVNGNVGRGELYFQIAGNASDGFQLSASHNPAREQTRLACRLWEADREAGGEVTFEVFTLTGVKVWQSERLPVDPGSFGASIVWDLTDFSGSSMPSGVYLYRAKVTTGGKTKESKAKKIIIVKQ